MKIAEYIGNREPEYLKQRQVIETNCFRKKVIESFFLVMGLIVMTFISLKDTPSDFFGLLLIIFVIIAAVGYGKAISLQVKQIEFLNKLYRDNSGVISLSQYEVFNDLFDGYDEEEEETESEQKLI